MKLLLVDDDITIRKGIEVFLQSEGHSVITAGNGKEALAFIGEHSFDCIISDVMMPVMNGLELLEKVQSLHYDLPFIAVTAYATVEDAVKAMKNGAEDYVTKPLNLAELKIRLNRIEERIALRKEHRLLKEKLRGMEFPAMIGCSKAMRSLQSIIEKAAADPDISVYIYGESGSGKEIAAREIHMQSSRSKNPFLAINCAALPEQLLESELFGYKKGAFTGAEKDKPGLFAAANGGTIFLDEISEASPVIQAKLLRALEERKVIPLGATEPIPFDVRIISASNKNAAGLVEAGSFRNDLFYRIAVLEIYIPPLRERVEDIPLLITHFLEKENRRKEGNFNLAPETIAILSGYSFPGNVRELQNLITKLTVTAGEEIIQPNHLPEHILTKAGLSSGVWKNLFNESDFQAALQKAVEKFEREFLFLHLKKNNWNVSRTAEAIQLSRVSLHKKMQQYNLKKTD